MGIALGEVVVADDTMTGAGVVLAQRLEQLARPGGVVVQGAGYETIPKHLPFQFESLGSKRLKGFNEPVRAFAVFEANERDNSAAPTNRAPTPGRRRAAR